MSEQERVNAGVQPATGAGEPTPIIFLDDIRVTFKTRTGSILHPNKVQAVRGLTLKLMPGETLGIVGESGCGKSTTANVMCGLQQPTSGKVFFKGEDVTKRSAAQRRLIGRVISVVFQDPATALNRAHERARPADGSAAWCTRWATRRPASSRVLDLIEMVGLPNSVLDALPGQLSGGQRQRVAIARALSLEPGRHHRRRAHQRPRRVGARADFEPADGSQDATWACPWCSSATTSRRCATFPTRSS